jgi:hypothetical protein
MKKFIVSLPLILYLVIILLSIIHNKFGITLVASIGLIFSLLYIININKNEKNPILVFSELGMLLFNFGILLVNIDINNFSYDIIILGSLNLIFSIIIIFSISNNKSINNNNWNILLDDFRKTDIYKKSNGQNLFPLFYEWLSNNYDAPNKK